MGQSDVLDTAELLERCADDWEFVREIAADFLQSSGDLHDSIRASLEAGDLKAVSEGAHSLKGASGNIAAHAYSETARALEERAEAGDDVGSRESFRELEAEAELLRAALEEVREHQPG